LSSDEARMIKRSLLFHDFRPRYPGDIHVSDVVICPRRAFFNARFNANPVAGPRATVGKAVHMLLREALKKSYPDASFEVTCIYPLEDGYALIGRADMVHGDVVYEFKYTSMHGGAKEAYFAQANSYACMLECRRFKVVIVDRDKLDVVILEGDVSEEAFQRILEKCAEIVKLLEVEEPDRLPGKAPWEWACRRCVYNMICRRVEQ